MNGTFTSTFHEWNLDFGTSRNLAFHEWNLDFGTSRNLTFHERNHDFGTSRNLTFHEWNLHFGTSRNLTFHEWNLHFGTSRNLTFHEWNLHCGTSRNLTFHEWNLHFGIGSIPSEPLGTWCKVSGGCPKPPRSFIGRTPSLSGCWGKKKLQNTMFEGLTSPVRGKKRKIFFLHETFKCPQEAAKCSAVAFFFVTTRGSDFVASLLKKPKGVVFCWVLFTKAQSKTTKNNKAKLANY